MIKDNVIIALDFENKIKTLAFLDKLDSDLEKQINNNNNICKKPYVKIGMELFYYEGASIIKEIKLRGHKIFLDLKLHDIPNTVKKAMHNLSNLGVDMTNVHAKGGIEMMRAAKEGFKTNSNTDFLLIAVTELTSISQEMMHNEFDINTDIKSSVLNLALNTKKAGLDGIVCSAQEVENINKNIKDSSFITVTPGIRQEGESKNDQARVVTPSKANKLGSSFIVVGRSITKSITPAKTYLKIYKEFNNII